MVRDASSSIKKISQLKYKERAFEWWGSSPDEARRVQTSKSHGPQDKRTTLKEAVKRFVKDEAQTQRPCFP